PDEHRRRDSGDLLRARFCAGARAGPLYPFTLGRHPGPRLGAEPARRPHQGSDAPGHSLSIYRAPNPAPTTRRTGIHMNRARDLKEILVSHQLVKYLEERGVEHIFGLCGHTNIAVLAALAGSRIKFINTRHEQVAAHIACGYAPPQRHTGVLVRLLGPSLNNRATGVE